MNFPCCHGLLNPKTTSIRRALPLVMSRYAPLATHLHHVEPGEMIRLNFNEIESILGFDLPSSARRHRAWWANENRGSHSHARYGWLAGGFRVVGVDLERE